MGSDRQFQNVFSLDDYVQWLRDLGRSPRTIDEYRRAVKRFLVQYATHDIDEFKQRHAIKFVRSRDVGAESHLMDCKGLLSLWKYMFSEGLVSQEDILDGWRPRGPRYPKPKGQVSDAEIEAMIENDELTDRERSLAQFLRETGCRSNAAAKMRTDDYYHDSLGVPYVRFLQEKMGQHIKREFDISGYLDLLLAKHIETRRGNSQWLWRADTRYDKKAPPRDVVEKIIKSAVVKTFGIKSPQYSRVTPHGFRYAFAQAMDRAGASMGEIQERLGHASIQTTQRYMHVNTDAARAAHRRFLEKFKPASKPEEVILPVKTRYFEYRFVLFAVEQLWDGTLGAGEPICGWNSELEARKGLIRFTDYIEGRMSHPPKVHKREVAVPRGTVLLVLMDIRLRERIEVWQRGQS